MKEKKANVLSLSTWERITLINLLGAVQPNLAGFRKGMRALDLLELSPEEKTQVGLQTLAPGRLAWRDVTKEWEIEFSQETLSFIKMVLKAPEAKLPLVRETDVLLKKLGIES